MKSGFIAAFNHDFVQGDYLFNYQTLGDFLRMWSIILTDITVVQVRLYMAWQLCSGLLFVVLVCLLIEVDGIEGATIAHAMRPLFMLFYLKYTRS